jgi:hypothetical protein
MENGKSDPFRFLSYLFEVAVWPFQAASRTTARELPLYDQRLTLIFLYPAMLILPLVCLLISVVAIFYVFFVAVPIVFFGQIVPEFVPKLSRPLLYLAAGLGAAAVVWALLQGLPTFGVSEIALAIAVMVILAGHQLPRIMRTMFGGSHS